MLDRVTEIGVLEGPFIHCDCVNNRWTSYLTGDKGTIPTEVWADLWVLVRNSMQIKSYMAPAMGYEGL